MIMIVIPNNLKWISSKTKQIEYNKTNLRRMDKGKMLINKSRENMGKSNETRKYLLHVLCCCACWRTWCHGGFVFIDGRGLRRI